MRLSRTAIAIRAMTPVAVTATSRPGARRGVPARGTPKNPASAGIWVFRVRIATNSTTPPIARAAAIASAPVVRMLTRGIAMKTTRDAPEGRPPRAVAGQARRRVGGAGLVVGHPRARCSLTRYRQATSPNATAAQPARTAMSTGSGGLPARLASRGSRSDTSA
jgi:hypothetical protein